MNASLGSEVTKLQKELELVRNQQPDGGKVMSLQEEVEKLREELQEAHTQRKKMEEEHGSEKLSLTQVRAHLKHLGQKVLVWSSVVVMMCLILSGWRSWRRRTPC